MTTRISTQPLKLLPSVRRWLAAAFARMAEYIDSRPMPSQHRMGSWEASIRGKPRE